MKLEEVILRDDRASQPAANTVPVGTLYYVTDESTTERSDGTNWETYADGGASSSFTSTSTGNIDDLDFQGASLIRMNNATLATIRGLLAGNDGQRVTIVSIGAGQVSLAHQNAGSSAGNRLINKVTTGITPLAAGTGAATYQYDATTARWRLIEHEQGDWITPAFSAGDYTADSSTWGVDAGDVDTFKYRLKGTSVEVNIWIDDTDVGSGNALLSITIPNSWNLATGRAQNTCFVSNAGSVTTGMIQTISAASATKISFVPSTSGGTWTATTSDNTKVHGILVFEID